MTGLRHRATAVLGGLALALAGLALTAPPGTAAAPAGTAAAAAAAPRIDFGRCEDETLREFGAQCGFLSVPLDHSRPNGRQIQLAVSRVRHKVPDAQYQGIMVVNPGGPGGSGLIYSILQGFVPKGAGEAYDWIGFDPRGVGASRPSLSCDPDYFSVDRPAYVPTTRHLERVWRDRAADYARACGEAGGALLEHMKTTDSARDLDAIRAALGERRLNYYGFSYGTYLMQVYATLFPDRVRRAVLDSNVDPRKVWYRANLDQDVAFDRNLGIFFGWVARHDDTYHLGTTRRAVENRFYGERDRLQRFTAPGGLGPAEWTDAFLLAGYVDFLWPATAEAFAAWANDRNPRPALSLYRSAVGAGDDNGYAVYLAVQCTDVQWPQSWAEWRRDNWRIHTRAPFLTWSNAWYNAPCLTWPAKAGRPVQVDGRGVAPLLLISETLDAATPFAGSREVRRRFPQSRLIGLPGGTNHANSLAGNPCVDNTIARYLLTGELPARKDGRAIDKVCQPLPHPEPGDESTTAARTATADLRALLPAVRR